MIGVHRVVDYATFAGSINKTKRHKFVEFVREEKRRKHVSDHMIQVMPMFGWNEYEKPTKEKRRDSGEIRALVKIQDGVVFFVLDNLEDGKEAFQYTLFDEAIVKFIGAESERQSAPASTITKKDGTPFAGFRGGRKKKELTAEEKAQILALREEGMNVNAIARELHISNRIISVFVKIK